MVIDLAMQIKDEIKHLITKNAELQRQVDSLTAERDELKSSYRIAQDVNERQDRQCIEQRERIDELQRELGYYVTAYRRAARERDRLARDLADAMDRGMA